MQASEISSWISQELSRSNIYRNIRIGLVLFRKGINTLFAPEQTLSTADLKNDMFKDVVHISMFQKAWILIKKSELPGCNDATIHASYLMFVAKHTSTRNKYQTAKTRITKQKIDISETDLRRIKTCVEKQKGKSIKSIYIFLPNK